MEKTEQQKIIIDLLLAGKELHEIREILNVSLNEFSRQILSKSFKKRYIKALNANETYCNETASLTTQNNEMNI